MKLPKRFSQKKILLLILIVGAVLANLILYINSGKKVQPPITSISAKNIAAKNLPIPDAGQPIRLKIPIINVDASIENVGQDSKGLMEIPKDIETAGWFELGKKPGEIGSAVIAGHYGLYAGKPTIFNELNKLKAGDEVITEDEIGTRVSFIVKEIRRYDPTANTTDIFSSDDEKAHLNLITCDGTWNKDAKSFDQRLVVFTDKK